MTGKEKPEKSGWKAVGSFPVLILKKWVEVAGAFD